MSLKVFKIATMIAISGPWVDNNKDRAALIGSPLTAGLVPLIEAAHRLLLELHVVPSADAEALRALMERAAALDAAHDDKLRALYALLTSFADAVGGPRGAVIRSARDTLLPGGVAMVQDSYLSESGAVELAVSRLTPEIEAVLAGNAVEGKSLRSYFDEWVALGRELGDIERQRVRLAERDEDEEVTQQDILNARHQWIRTVNALKCLLDLESDIPEETRIRILQPLRNAEAKARQKRSARVDEASPEETEESLNSSPADQSAVQ